jgi:selT/selW/selH-like putative selenoprotein
LCGSPTTKRALKDFLSKEFRDLIKVNEQMDRGVTGNFEVTIVDTGKLIHSKRQGHGFADTAKERQSIVEQIKEAMRTV